MVTLAALPLILAILSTLALWREHEIADARSTAVLVARRFASTYDQEIGAARGTLYRIARAAQGADADDRLTAAFTAVQRERPWYLAVGAFTPAGHLVSTGPLRVGADLAQRPVFRRALETGRFTIGDREFDPAAKRVTVTFAMPAGRTPDVDGRLVFAVMDLALVQELAAAETLLPRGTAVTIFDAAGTIVARWPEAAAWVGRSIPQDPVVRAALERPDEGALEATSVDGVARLLAFVPLRPFDGSPELFLSVGIPRAAATARADALMLTHAGTFGALFLLAVTVAGVTGRRFAKVHEAMAADLDHARARLGELETARAQADGPERDAARRAVEKLWPVIEQTADSVLISDRDGVIEYVNPAFEAMSGYTRDEAIGRTPNILRSGVQSQRFYETMWNTILSGRTFRTTIKNRRKDGTVYDQDEIITPIRDASGTITHFVSTGRDVTQRNRTQEALRRLNHQLEMEATRIAGTLHDEAGQFLASAHITLADVARDVDAVTASRLTSVRRHLEQVEERLRHVAHEMHPRVVEDLGLRDAVTFFSESFARRTGIRVTVESNVEKRYPLAIETLLYRVVQEGLTNASRHAQAKNVVVALKGCEETICCSIRDDGVGFDPAPASARMDGGLGLPVMRDRLEAVGGDLTVESARGKGTVLRATVPVEE